jgi:hypothetical protein
MTSDDLLPVIDQEGQVESKRVDTLSDLADLFVAMNPGVSRVGFQGCRTEVGNLQTAWSTIAFLSPFSRSTVAL